MSIFFPLFLSLPVALLLSPSHTGERLMFTNRCILFTHYNRECVLMWMASLSIFLHCYCIDTWQLLSLVMLQKKRRYEQPWTTNNQAPSSLQLAELTAQLFFPSLITIRTVTEKRYWSTTNLNSNCVFPDYYQYLNDALSILTYNEYIDMSPLIMISGSEGNMRMDSN